MEIRPYTPSDYNDIVELSKYIWDGNDYLPFTINEYYENEHCEPYVVLEDEKVVAVANAHFFTNNFVWLEAMRTHPDHRGKGLATKLTEKMLEVARLKGTKEAWLSTSKNNEATGKIMQRLGFEDIFSINVWGFLDQEIDEKEVKEKKGIINGFLVDISYLEQNISDSVRQLSMKWNKVTSIKELENSTEFLFSEFMICPSTSHFIPTWIKNGYIFKHEDNKSIITVKESKEENGMFIIGISGLPNPDLALSAVYFGFQVSKKKFENNYSKEYNFSVSLFFNQDITIPLLETKWVFRILKKELI